MQAPTQSWLVSVLLVLALAVCMHSSVHALDVGAHAPTLGVKDAKDRVVAIPRGKVVLVDLWASWCGPCKKELPALQRLYNKHAKRGFRVIAVNIDKDRKNADAFLAQHPVGFVVAYDPESSVPSKYEPKTMPSSYLIDHRGLVKQVYTGYHDGDDAKIEEDVVALLEALPVAKQDAKPTDESAPVAAETPAPVATPQATTPVAPETVEPASPPPPSAAEAPPANDATQPDGRPRSVQPSAAGRSGGLCSVARTRSETAPAWSLVLAATAIALLARRKRQRNA